ncbi:MAG: diaminopimelate epimerase [Methylobacterium frigidaeris]
MSPLAHRRFLKMNGLGNEIVVLDLRGSSDRVRPQEARAIAAGPRSRFDQLMVLHDADRPGVDAALRIYNTDGSEAGACGNGTRCVAWAMMDDPVMARPAPGGRLGLESRAGLLTVERVSATDFTVDMGAPRLHWDEIPLAGPVPDTSRIALQSEPGDEPVLSAPGVVSMGNPHAVFFVERDPEDYDLARIGPHLETHPIFPERANISVARIRDRGHISLRVWERGAGLTRACGTAACAALVAAARLGLADRRAVVTLPGGDLTIAWGEDGHVRMTGPTELEWEGTFAPDLFAGAA